MLRIVGKLGWRGREWIVVPGGILVNSSAFGKAFGELKMLGLIDSIPRLAVVNATGASTLSDLVNDKKLRWNGGRVEQAVIDAYYDDLTAKGFSPHTCASAIEISRPVNLKKCLRALELCDGVVLAVSDVEIVDAKAQIGSHGLVCARGRAAQRAAS